MKIINTAMLSRVRGGNKSDGTPGVAALRDREANVAEKICDLMQEVRPYMTRDQACSAGSVAAFMGRR